MITTKVSFVLLALLHFAVDNNKVSTLSPPPRDPDWLGWHCRTYRRGEHDGKCIRVVHDAMSTFSDAAGICAKEKRKGDILTPSILSIDSQDEQDFVIHRIMWGAGLFGGGNFGAWVSPSNYLTTQLANHSNKNTQASGEDCVLLQIDVDSKGPPGQPSGYGFNAKNVSFNLNPCNASNRIVCQTRKWTQTGLLDTVSKQKAELETLKEKFEDALKNLTKLKESHCGVDPKKRTVCGPPEIEQWRCLELGCCFDNNAKHSVQCFDKVMDAKLTHMDKMDKIP